jgi:hypothetical protein
MTTSTSPARQAFIPNGQTLKDNASLFDYTEQSPYRAMGEKLTWAQVLAYFKAKRHITGDCSMAYTDQCEWNPHGVSDPNRLNFDGYGFTGTLLESMPILPLAELEIADAIVMGPGTGDHVVYVFDKKGSADPMDWIVWSHGRPGVDLNPLRDSLIYAGVELRGCSLAPFLPATPAPVPTMHYERYEDKIKRKMKYGPDRTEKEWAENYDKFRAHPVLYAVQWTRSKANGKIFVTALANVEEAQDPQGKHYWRHWRRARAQARVDGKQIKKTL